MRNSGGDKNISGITDKIHPAGVFLIYINGLAELNQGFWVRNVSKMNGKMTLMGVILRTD